MTDVLDAPGALRRPGAAPERASSAHEGGPEVVIVCWGSFMAASNGSHVRVASLLDFLRARFARVAVYGHREHPAEPWTQEARRAFAARFPGVALVLDHETRAMRWAKKAKEAAVTLVPGAAPRILALGLPGQAPGLARLMRSGPAVVVNYVDGLARLNGVPCDRAVVETHDVKSVKRAKAEGRPTLGARGLMRLRNEVASLGAAAGVVAITRAEAAFFRMMLDRGRVLCVPLYDEAAPVAPPSGDHDHDLLFAASENPLNVRGFLDFAREAAPWLGRRRVALCGRICEVPAIREHAAAHPGVELLGFVDDLPALLARTRACLSPTDGTGLKIKVVEALRHGKPVFASRHSMDGLTPGHERCVLPLDRASVEGLLDDPRALAEASAAARAYFAAFSDEGDRAALVELLRGLAAVEARGAAA